VLRTAVEIETTEEGMQDWLELDEGDAEFQLQTEEEIAAVTFYLFVFISPTYIFEVFWGYLLLY
jgi:hypothetical protein